MLFVVIKVSEQDLSEDGDGAAGGGACVHVSPISENTLKYRPSF